MMNWKFWEKEFEPTYIAPRPKILTPYTLQMKAVFGDDRNEVYEKANLFARAYVARSIDLRILTTTEDLDMFKIRNKTNKLTWISVINYVVVSTANPLTDHYTVRLEIFRDNNLDSVISQLNAFALGVEAVNIEIRQTPKVYLDSDTSKKEVMWYGYVTYKVEPGGY